MEDIVSNHIVAVSVDEFPKKVRKYREILEGRSIMVKKADPLPVECIVRGYLAGSGWNEYVEEGTVCGLFLPHGLVESSMLPEPIYTPSTKAAEGHDINITFEEVIRIVGGDVAETLRGLSLRIYGKAREVAEKKGIIIADTKMEFGFFRGGIILIDELLTPDSSRFWSTRDYRPGGGQDSFDKQIVRDYLLTLDWDKTYPGPLLPEEIVSKTAARYREILEILTG